jgi:DNA-3-methyladenine glycosylase II
VTHLILGQQVSIEAADAMYARLVGLVGLPTPETLLSLDDDTMRLCGFTAMKASYARGFAETMLDGFDLAAVATMEAEDAIATLTALRGIGRWTAECYLLFCEGRRDVFPAGDLALRVGWQEIAGLAQPPTEAELRIIAGDWAPRRSAAAHLIWHSYLKSRGRR